MTATLTQNNLLDYLRGSKRGLTPEQQRMCDDFVLGVLSLHVPEQVWEDAVDMAVRMATKTEHQAWVYFQVLFVFALVGVPLYLLCRLLWAAIKKLEKP